MIGRPNLGHFIFSHKIAIPIIYMCISGGMAAEADSLTPGRQKKAGGWASIQQQQGFLAAGKQFITSLFPLLHGSLPRKAKWRWFLHTWVEGPIFRRVLEFMNSECSEGRVSKVYRELRWFSSSKLGLLPELFKKKFLPWV